MSGLERPLRAILVGAGGMGRAWLRTLADAENVELAGVVDIDLASAKAATAWFAAETRAAEAPAGDDLAAMAGSEAADFVLDVTVPEAHHPVTLRALSLGLPVLGEKPLAASLPEALELAAAAEAYDRLFMVSQSRRYNPRLFAYRDQIRGLGRLGMLNATFFKAPHFGGFRDEMASPLVLDMAIHAFDAARFLAGAEPVAVYCEEFNPAWSWYDGDAAANALFELTGGARFVFNGSWCSEGMETSWNSSWRASSEGGTALWDGDGDPRSEQVPAAGNALPSAHSAAPGFGGHSGLGGSLREFVAALRTGVPPMGEAHDNILSLAMVHAAIESSRTRRRILLADLLEAAHAEALAKTTGALHDALAGWTTLTPPAAP